MESTESFPASLAKAQHCFVVAPAGCGKTELIVDAVNHSTRKNLILTHTHAGVQSLRNRFKKKKVNPNLFSIQTLDGWCYKWTSSYPELCGLNPETAKLEQPDTDWSHIRECMLRLISSSFFIKSFRLTYEGLYVDEYQDCVGTQHELVVKLSEYVPTKVLGDPLQKLFGFAGAINWSEKVESEFEHLQVPFNPWRWSGQNEPMGAWLLSIREKIQDGTLSLTNLPIGVSWQNVAVPGALIAKCKSALSLDGSVLVIHNWPHNCYQLSKMLKATYKSMEAIDSKELTEFLHGIDMTTNSDEKLKIILNFAISCYSTAEGNFIKQYLRKLECSQSVGSLRTNIWLKTQILGFSNDLNGVYLLLKEIEKNLGRKQIHRIELWSEAIKSIEYCLKRSDSTSLIKAGLAVRNTTRVVGRPKFRSSVSRTLLVKGLEYDHVIIANADALGDADSRKENLYVALTRARKTLTIFSSSRTINFTLT